jgi:hypothetical protein
MNSEQKSATGSSRGGMTLSLGFYLGIGILLLFLAAGALFSAPPRPLIDQHANPIPATPPPAQVLTAPGSNLYHAGPSCPYAHRNSKLIDSSKAVHEGLVPCAYCIGNSAVRLTPIVISHPSER